MRLWDAATGNLLAGPIGTSENFLRIGHSLLALVVAFLGATSPDTCTTWERLVEPGRPRSASPSALERESV